MLRSRIRVVFFLSLLIVFTAHLEAQTASSKISWDLQNQPSTGNVPVIVQYYNPPSSLETLLLGLLGGVVNLVLGTINALAINVPYNSLNALAADANVKYISLDRSVAARQEVVIPAANYTVEPINAPVVWQKGYIGTNIGVAVIDSGITPAPDLASNSLTLPLGQPIVAQLLAATSEVAPWSNGRIVYSQNFVPGQSDALDHYGHGTHVSGLIAGNGAQSSGTQYFRTFYGSAPNANIINLRVLDENGAGTDSAVIAAISRAIALKNTFNIRVINLSLGRPIYESYTLDPLCQAVEKAWQAGIVVVVAAGNDGRDLNASPEGYGTINAPGNDPYVLTVGAMNTQFTPQLSDDIIASYSSKGPSFVDHFVKPDIVAPGNLVTSLEYADDQLAVENPSFYTWYSFYQTNGSETPSSAYFPLSGTSMATGVTSGAVADLLQAAPQLTPNQVKARIMANGDRSYFPATSSVTADGIVFNANYDVFTVGAGYLDIAATIQAALSNNDPVPAGTAMSPVATYNATSGQTTAVTDPSALWQPAGPWSASSVYGNHAFISGANSPAIWGTTGIWGEEDPNGFTVLWGKTGPWSEGTPDAATVLWGKSSTEGSTVLWGKSGDSGSNVPTE
ncbi:MAG TPA: S8 family peptidase [Terracidiphilus sp.]|nr:S8 family peptidase [Terracidiphilus sp.]